MNFDSYRYLADPMRHADTLACNDYFFSAVLTMALRRACPVLSVSRARGHFKIKGFVCQTLYTHFRNNIKVETETEIDYCFLFLNGPYVHCLSAPQLR